MTSVSSPQFSGRTQCNSIFNGLYKPGMTVVRVTSTEEDFLGTTFPKTKSVAKVVRSIEPHQGRADSEGLRVPDNAPEDQDQVDLVTFEDDSTALVGNYTAPHGEGQSIYYELSDRDLAGQPVSFSLDTPVVRTVEYLSIRQALKKLEQAPTLLVRHITNRLLGYETPQA